MAHIEQILKAQAKATTAKPEVLTTLPEMDGDSDVKRLEESFSKLDYQKV